jgi:hypothetical protein
MSMKVLRTPETRFANLPDYPFAPNFVQITPELRLHYIDEGPQDATSVLNARITADISKTCAGNSPVCAVSAAKFSAN